MAWWFPPSAQALPNADTQALSQGDEPMALTEHLKVLKQAPDATTPVSQVLQQDGWQPATVENRNSSWVASTVWLTGLVRNPSDRPVTRWIVVSPWRIDDVQLYLMNPEGTQVMAHQLAGLGRLKSTPGRQFVESVFPVTIAAGETVRLLVRLQDETVTTSFVTAWQPEAYLRHLNAQILREAVTVAVALTLLVVLVLTADWQLVLVAGWLATAVGFEITFHGQSLLHFVPGLADWIIPIFMGLGSLGYLLFTVSAWVLNGLDRRSVWAWIAGGGNVVALISAGAVVFPACQIIARQVIGVMGLVILTTWLIASWRTPLADVPQARVIRWLFNLFGASMLLYVMTSRGGPLGHALRSAQDYVRFDVLTILCVTLVYLRVRHQTQENDRRRTEFLAFHDALTGLPNRVRGLSQLSQAVAAGLRQNHPVSVLYLDMDKFKHVNDTHGHPIGDALLKGVASRLSASVAGSGTVCRLSGDEFMVVLPGVGQPEQVARHCQALLSELSAPFRLADLQLHTSFSIGVATSPDDGLDGETLMRHADIALFEAKKSGENRFCRFEQQMNTRVIDHAQTRAMLHQALERGEFELHYQPQIDLHTRRVTGLEALIRWNRPGRGLTLPGEFIAVAEESGLIVPIGRWVLREACRQASLWRAAGWQDLTVAVNVSAVQFRSGHLTQDVAAALADSGLAPGGLELELTESVLVSHTDEALRALGQLKALGTQLALDDFGTGYCGLSYLRQFNVDTVKIDRSFIVNAEHNAEDRAIVQAVVQLARNLKLHTVAEGVETDGVAWLMAAAGCDRIQGHQVARPMPAQDVVRWLTAWKASTSAQETPTHALDAGLQHGV